MAKGYVIDSPSEIKEFKGEIMLKSQVHSGGRGKAGGIKKAGSMDEAKDVATKLFNLTIKGYHVEKLFIQPAYELQKQYYIGYAIDRDSKSPILLASASGGGDIEGNAKTSMKKISINPLEGFNENEIRKNLGDEFGKDTDEVISIAEKLYQVMLKYDATMCEINPLAKTPEGLVGVDSKMTIDDNSLFRQNENASEADLQLTEIELFAREKNLSYVELEGNIAVIGCGAGLVMASLDALETFGGDAANFLDIGGGASQQNMEDAVKTCLMKKGVKSLFINIFAGITRCDDIANAIIEMKPKLPTSIRMMGTNEDEGKRILRDARYHVFDSMEEAAKDAVEKAK